MIESAGKSPCSRMISTRRRVLGLLIAFGAMPLSHAQKRSLQRVGLLWVGSSGMSDLRTALIDGLREQGFVEGSHLVFDDQLFPPLEFAENAPHKKYTCAVSFCDLVSTTADRLSTEILTDVHSSLPHDSESDSLCSAIWR